MNSSCVSLRIYKRFNLESKNSVKTNVKGRRRKEEAARTSDVCVRRDHGRTL